MSKKCKRVPNGKSSPLIRSEAFPKSPFSPNLKLKEKHEDRDPNHRSLAVKNNLVAWRIKVWNCTDTFQRLKRRAGPCPHPSHENCIVELSWIGKNHDSSSLTRLNSEAFLGGSFLM